MGICEKAAGPFDAVPLMCVLAGLLLWRCGSVYVCVSRAFVVAGAAVCWFGECLAVGRAKIEHNEE